MPPGLRNIKQKTISKTSQADSLSTDELLVKLKKQDEKVKDLQETIEIINTEIEDLTVENMDLKEKYDLMVKGGVTSIGLYHKELLKASNAFEQIGLKV